MVSHSDSFTVYLPSNSPGSVPQAKSENPSAAVSAWFKARLDQTYELEGDHWEIGLAEICFPSELLSHIEEEFTVGIRILNPLKNWTKKVRNDYISTFVAGLSEDRYLEQTYKSQLDDRW